MIVIRRLLMVLGLIGALLAAEGLNRFGSFIAAMHGADAGFYQSFLIWAVLAAGALFAGLLGKTHMAVKIVSIIGVLGCLGMMLMAPALPVNIQIFFGLVFALLGLVAMPRRDKPASAPVPSAASPTAS